MFRRVVETNVFIYGPYPCLFILQHRARASNISHMRWIQDCSPNTVQRLATGKKILIKIHFCLISQFVYN